MSILVAAGQFALAVTTSEIDVLTSNDTSTGIARVSRWGCALSVVDATVNVKVYRARGENVGFVEVPALRMTIAAGGVGEITWGPDECSARIRITAQATAGTAHVSSDYRGEGNY